MAVLYILTRKKFWLAIRNMIECDGICKLHILKLLRAVVSKCAFGRIYNRKDSTGFFKRSRKIKFETHAEHFYYFDRLWIHTYIHSTFCYNWVNWIFSFQFWFESSYFCYMLHFLIQLRRCTANIFFLFFPYSYTTHLYTKTTHLSWPTT